MLILEFLLGLPPLEMSPRLSSSLNGHNEELLRRIVNPKLRVPLSIILASNLRAIHKESEILELRKDLDP